MIKKSRARVFSHHEVSVRGCDDSAHRDLRARAASAVGEAASAAAKAEANAAAAAAAVTRENAALSKVGMYGAAGLARLTPHGLKGDWISNFS